MRAPVAVDCFLRCAGCVCVSSVRQYEDEEVRARVDALIVEVRTRSCPAGARLQRACCGAVEQATGRTTRRTGTHLAVCCPTAALLHAIVSCVAQEMRRFTPPDYLAKLPAPPAPKFGGSALLAAEYERVASQQRLQAIDTRR